MVDGREARVEHFSSVYQRSMKRYHPETLLSAVIHNDMDGTSPSRQKNHQSEGCNNAEEMINMSTNLMSTSNPEGEDGHVSEPDQNQMRNHPSSSQTMPIFGPSPDSNMSNSRNQDRPNQDTRNLRLRAPYFYYRDFSQVADDDPLIPLTPLARVPNFPAKMHSILSCPSLSDVVAWMPHGRSWRVLKPRDFEVRVIPMYFEHQKFSSFIRQANGWGFRRITQGRDRNSYYHELFLRGLPHLCKKMKRPGVKKKIAVDAEFEPDLYAINEMHPLPDESRADINLLLPNSLLGRIARDQPHIPTNTNGMESNFNAGDNASHGLELMKESINYHQLSTANIQTLLALSMQNRNTLQSPLQGLEPGSSPGINTSTAEVNPFSLISHYAQQNLPSFTNFQQALMNRKQTESQPSVLQQVVAAMAASQNLPVHELNTLDRLSEDINYQIDPINSLLQAYKQSPSPSNLRTQSQYNRQSEATQRITSAFQGAIDPAAVALAMQQHPNNWPTTRQSYAGDSTIGTMPSVAAMLRNAHQTTSPTNDAEQSGATLGNASNQLATGFEATTASRISNSFGIEDLVSQSQVAIGDQQPVGTYYEIKRDR